MGLRLAEPPGAADAIAANAGETDAGAASAGAEAGAAEAGAANAGAADAGANHGGEAEAGAETSESAGDGVLELALIAEPVDLRDDLRALAADRPALARAEAPRRLAAVAAAAWRNELARNQVPTSIIEPAFQSARREIWLWVGGDRNWRQVGPSLAGRVVRRGSARPSPAGPPGAGTPQSRLPRRPVRREPARASR